MHDVWVWVIGIPFGFFLAILLLINANAGLLLYVLAMPALPATHENDHGHPWLLSNDCLGGPLQTMILLAGIWMAVSSKARLSKMPAVKVFPALWLVMGISIILAPGNAGLRIGWLTQFMPRKTDYVAAIKEWNRIGSYIFIYILAGLTLYGEKGITRFVKVLLLSLPIPLALSIYQIVFHAGFVPDSSMVGKLQQDHGHFRQPGRIGFVSHLSFAPMYYNGHGQKNEAATPVVFCILRCIIVYLFVSHLYKIIMVRHNGGYYGYWPEEK